MPRKIKLVDLETEIEKQLKEYGDNVLAFTRASSEAVAKKTVQILRTTGDYEDRTGKYRKSFRWKSISTFRGTICTVYSAKYYRLTHLLEKSHAINGGTRRTQAFPHWEPAERQAINEFVGLMEKGLPHI